MKSWRANVPSEGFMIYSPCAVQYTIRGYLVPISNFPNRWLMIIRVTRRTAPSVNMQGVAVFLGAAVFATIIFGIAWRFFAIAIRMVNRAIMVARSWKCNWRRQYLISAKKG